MLQVCQDPRSNDMQDGCMWRMTVMSTCSTASSIAALLIGCQWQLCDQCVSYKALRSCS